jgi:hypothetical protein
MQRRQVLFGVLGLALAATAVRADVPKTVTILGQQYTVTTTPRAGTFKNGVTVNLQKGGGGVDDADVPKKANLAFVPDAGGDATKDRLFVVAAVQDDPGPTMDGLYILTGTDANGVFSPANSDATALLRGNKDVCGRMQSFTFLSDDNSNPGKNRNFYTFTFTGQDRMRWFDLGALQAGAPHTNDNAFRELTVFSIRQPIDTGDTTDPDPVQDVNDDNCPADDSDVGALAPNGMMIVAGQDNGTIALGVIDPIKGEKFFPVKTDLVAATGGDQIDAAQVPHAFVRVGGDEYLMIATDPGTGQNGVEADLNSQTLYRLQITLPADLANGQADSIKAKVLGKEDLPALGLGQSDTHKIQGLVVGRNAASGKPILYMADWVGNLFTLTPQ